MTPTRTHRPTPAQAAVLRRLANGWHIELGPVTGHAFLVSRDRRHVEGVSEGMFTALKQWGYVEAHGSEWRIGETAMRWVARHPEGQ